MKRIPSLFISDHHRRNNNNDKSSNNIKPTARRRGGSTRTHAYPSISSSSRVVVVVLLLGRLVSTPVSLYHVERTRLIEQRAAHPHAIATPSLRHEIERERERERTKRRIINVQYKRNSNEYTACVRVQGDDGRGGVARITSRN